MAEATTVSRGLTLTIFTLYLPPDGLSTNLWWYRSIRMGEGSRRGVVVISCFVLRSFPPFLRYRRRYELQFHTRIPMICHEIAPKSALEHKLFMKNTPFLRSRRLQCKPKAARNYLCVMEFCCRRGPYPSLNPSGWNQSVH